MAEGVRVWRWRKARGGWFYESHTGATKVLPFDRVDSRITNAEEGDFLLEETARTTGSADQFPDLIRWDAILSVFPQSWVPEDSGLWCKVSDDRRSRNYGLRMIYMRRRASSDDPPPPYFGLLSDDLAAGDIVVDRGLWDAPDQEPIHVIRRGGARAQIEIECFAEGRLPLDIVADVLTERDDPALAAFSAGCSWFATNRQALEQNFRAVHEAIENNQPGKLTAAVDVLEKLVTGITGATPGPTQGHNVGLQTVSALNDLGRTCMAMASGGAPGAQMATDASGNALPVTGGLDAFTSGTSAVDNTWQAIGSVINSIITAIKVRDAYSTRETAREVGTAPLVGMERSGGMPGTTPPAPVTGPTGKTLQRVPATRDLKALQQPIPTHGTTPSQVQVAPIMGPTGVRVDKSLQRLAATRDLKMLCTELGFNATKAFTTVGSSINSIASLAGTASATMGAFASQGIPLVGAGISFAAMVRSARQAELTRKRLAKLKLIDQLARQNPGELKLSTQEILSFAVDKLERRYGYKTTEATVNALSTAAGVALGVVAIVAGVNAWNPVGWGLAVVVVAAGTGLLIYKIYRKKKSKSDAQRRGWSGDKFPDKLIEAYKKEFLTFASIRKSATMTMTSLDLAILDGLLAGFGIDGWRLPFPGEENVARSLIRSRMAY
jgi:hypothetical protein